MDLQLLHLLLALAMPVLLGLQDLALLLACLLHGCQLVSHLLQLFLQMSTWWGRCSTVQYLEVLQKGPAWCQQVLHRPHICMHSVTAVRQGSRLAWSFTKVLYASPCKLALHLCLQNHKAAACTQVSMAPEMAGAADRSCWECAPAQRHCSSGHKCALRPHLLVLLPLLQSLAQLLLLLELLRELSDHGLKVFVGVLLLLKCTPQLSSLRL